MHTKDTKKPQFAFIIGQHRSGTTMLRNICEQHPDIATTPELYAFERLWGKRFLASKNTLFEQARTRFKITSERREQLDKNTSWWDFLAVLAKGTASKKAYETLVVKTPVNVYFADLLMRQFPDAAIMFITRDGRDICASAVKKWGEKGAKPLSIAARWALTMRAYERTLKNKPHHFIRYEDITGNTEETLNKLFAYLGHTYNPQFADQIGATSSFSGVKQSGIYKSSHFSSFFDENTQRTIEGLLKPLLTQYGYTLTFTTHHISLKTRFVFLYHYYKHALYFMLTRFGLRSVWRSLPNKK